MPLLSFPGSPRAGLFIAGMTAALLLAACARGPAYTPPTTPVPVRSPNACAGNWKRGSATAARPVASPCCDWCPRRSRRSVVVGSGSGAMIRPDVILGLRPDGSGGGLSGTCAGANRRGGLSGIPESQPRFEDGA